jgi:chaperonin GroES
MIQPIRDKILVERAAANSITHGGIVIPEAFKETSAKGKIVAVGRGTKDRPMRLPIGATCWFVKTAGDEIIENGITYLLMPDREVLGYLEN